MAAINIFDYATGDGVTDDFAGITAAITAARTSGKSLVIPDDPAAHFAHSGTINWGWYYLKVIAQSGAAKFRHTGSGIAHSFNGYANYSGQGCAGGVFGGPNRIFLEGNANTTDLVLIDNWHMGEMKISGKNATNSILRGQDTGVVNACAVESTFDVHATSNSSGIQTVVPNYGIRMVKPAACIFEKMLVEFCGNSGYGTPGVSLVNANGNTFRGGTVESCLAGGVSLNGGERNIFDGVHCEVNGVVNGDWTISNCKNNTFRNCVGASTAAGQYLAGNLNRYENCKFEKVLIPPGSTKNTFKNPIFIGTFTDQGTGTVVENPTYI